MRRAGMSIAWLLAAALALAIATVPAAATAAEPEKIFGKVFDVVVGPGPVLEITFPATLSEISSYPVTVTAVQGSTEEKLWEGVLGEGLYRLRAPLQRITSGQVRVIVRVKMTNLDAKGNQSYYVYRRWEGSISR
ncbi:MAG TPA: hypothetical protein VI078_13780 [bacterium]